MINSEDFKSSKYIKKFMKSAVRAMTSAAMRHEDALCMFWDKFIYETYVTSRDIKRAIQEYKANKSPEKDKKNKFRASSTFTTTYLTK